MLDPDVAPLYWQEPSMLLGLFGEMAERNLFLVQHLQVGLAPMPRTSPASPCCGMHTTISVASVQHTPS